MRRKMTEKLLWMKYQGGFEKAPSLMARTKTGAYFAWPDFRDAHRQCDRVFISYTVYFVEAAAAGVVDCIEFINETDEF
jgi:hypothetical protein